jgi:uncharacterized membrane protein YoaK (UPF0700 family)
MSALHEPRSVFSLRHLPSWLMLAFAAGAVNVIAFVACSRFVSHVTGSVAQLGMDIGELAVDYAVVVGCFVAGAMSAAALVEGRSHRHKRPLFAVPLLIVSAILTSIASAGGAGMFGPFGGSIESARDLPFVLLLAFAMGLQNGAVASSTGQVVRTTHMTGPATDLGLHLTTAFYAQGNARLASLRHAGLRAAKIVAFGAGAAAGAVLAGPLGYAAFFVPAALVLVATALSFLPVARAPAPA